MEYEIDFTDDAKKDLFDIYYYVAKYDSFDKADRLRNELYEKINSLSSLPERGFRIKEIIEERPDIYQIILFPYNILYKVKKNKVNILAILDGRRDVNVILKERFIKEKKNKQ